LLFVLALILIVSSHRGLPWTITAFTLAHSITLSLATLGVVRVPGPPVEAMIALSILLLACEVVRLERGQAYYVRVLEIPTPRWTLIQAVKSGLPPPDVVPLTGQERAWTSPIWYTPSADSRKNAEAGTTVADLKKKGAAALGDAQLKALLVGKAHWFRTT
jgi:HupE/UreJ protein/uncharacterized protein DUF3604